MIKLDIEGFKNYLLINDRKVSTTYRHANILKILEKELNDFTYEEITRFLVKYKFEEKRHSYLNQFIDTLAVYCRFKDIPMPKFKHYKDETFVKAIMSDEEIEGFLALPCPIFRQKHRNGIYYLRRTDPVGWAISTMFWKVCAFTGMRMGEVAKLNINDIDFGRDVFVVRDSKINEPRLVPIAPNLKESLKSYIANLPGELLFASRRGGGINSGRDGRVMDNVDWHYNFHKRLDQLGIKRTNLTPYSLRHSMITSLLEQDVALFKVQKIVGHHRIDTTLAYTHLTTKDIQEAIRKHPLIRRSSDPKFILQSLMFLIKSYQLEKDDRFKFTLTETERGISLDVELNEAFITDTTVRYKTKGGVIAVVSKIPGD